MGSNKVAAKDYHQPLQHQREAATAPLKMDDWERKMRSDLASIQKKYKEKYKELYKLQHKSASSPFKKVTNNHAASGSSTMASNKVNHHSTKKTLAPISPWLQTFKLKVNGQHNDKVEPPKHHEKKSNSVTTIPNGKESKLGPDLSVITSKFRSARPNPFENLLKLSGKKNSSEVSNKNEEEEENNFIDDEDKPLMTSTPKLHVLKNGGKAKKEAFLVSSHHSNDLNNKSLPKLHLANNNKVQDHVDEDNEAAAVEADISDEEDDEDDAPPVLEPMQELPPSSNATASAASVASKQPQQNITVKIKRPPSPPTSSSPCSSPKTKKSKKEKKAKKAKKEHRHHHHHKKHHKKQSMPITVHVNDDSKAPADCIDLLSKALTKTSTGKNKASPAQNGSKSPSIDRKGKKTSLKTKRS